MGFDPAQKKQQIATWKEVIATPVLVVGHGLMKMVGLIQKLGETLQGKERVNYKNFLEAIKTGFSDYLTTCLVACDN